MWFHKLLVRATIWLNCNVKHFVWTNFFWKISIDTLNFLWKCFRHKFSLSRTIDLCLIDLNFLSLRTVDLKKPSHLPDPTNLELLRSIVLNSFQTPGSYSLRRKISLSSCQRLFTSLGIPWTRTKLFHAIYNFCSLSFLIGFQLFLWLSLKLFYRSIFLSWLVQISGTLQNQKTFAVELVALISLSRVSR